MLGIAFATATLADPDRAGRATAFDPQVHGFDFCNAFEGPIWVELPLLGRVTLGQGRHGLCGGMALAAADNFVAGAHAPNQPAGPDGRPAPPPQKHPLRDHLHRRQLDSFVQGNARVVWRTALWMTLPLESSWPITGLADRSERELREHIAPAIDQGRVVPIVLVRDHVFECAPFNGRAWSLADFQNNHQVLAIGYRWIDDAQAKPQQAPMPAPEDAPAPADPGHWAIDIYDPNFPDRICVLHLGTDHGTQTFRPRAEPDHVPAENRSGLALGQRVIGTFRGLFAAPYTPAEPFRAADEPSPT